jgi:HAD superfamily 5'-nucleotidase-like hydrolase
MLVAPDQAPDPLDDAEVERLLASHRPEVERARQIFVNRNLRMDGIELVGFDMDYTLAIYHMRRIEELSFRMTVQRLIARGYPQALAQVDYDHTFVIRGLCIDKQLGNIFKMDRHQHVGRCHHGRRRLTRDERKAIYRNEKIRVGSDRFAWIDTLFELPEAALFADLVDIFEFRGEKIDYGKLYADIRETIDSVHRDGTLKAELKKDLASYILKDAELGPALHKLRSGGKKLFLLTNSYWDYTDAVMKFLLDGVLHEYPSWRNYFDVVIVGAQKPGWFSPPEPRPFLELDAAGEPAGEAQSLEKGRAYQGGNLGDFERLVGIAGEKILYVGDHIYGDIIRNRKSSLWRTCMIVQEIENEIRHVEEHAKDYARLRQLERLRERVDDAINHHKLEMAALDRYLEDARKAGDENGVAQIDEQRRVEKGHLEKLRRAHKSALAESSRLDAQVQDSYNPHWGLIFKSGGENSRFGEQIEDYACLYTSRASNFVYYSPMQYFRSPRDQMPHERLNGV